MTLATHTWQAGQPQDGQKTPAAPRTLRLGRHRSRIAAAVLPGTARRASLLAASILAVIALPAGLQTPLFLALPFLGLPLALATAIAIARAFDFSKGSFAISRALPLALNVAALMSLLCAVSAVTIPTLPGSRLAEAAAAIFFWTMGIHMVAASLFDILRRRGVFCETAVIVGATDKARRLIEGNRNARELDIVGVFDDRLSRAPAAVGNVPVIGRLDDLLGWDQLPHIDRIIVTLSGDARERVRSLIDRLRVLPQKVVLLLDLDDYSPDGSQTLARIARSPAAYVCGEPEDLRRAIVKRITDFAFAVLLLAAFSPILVAIAVAIRLDSPGPILFRQRRQGFNNRIIRVWKFRSMREDKAAETVMKFQAVANDPRVTRVGRFIRATSLDELPQLVNVLRGEMSIVGPRPHALGMTADETEMHAIVADYAHRHRTKPGITGWAQINGSRGPVHTRDEVRERVRLDLEYVNRSSFWLDLYIMVMTIPCLLGDRRRAR